jgi:hypothetical protein
MSVDQERLARINAAAGLSIVESPPDVPAVDDDPEAKQWAEDLAKARADVEARLANATKQRAPLFIDGASLLQEEFADDPYLVEKLITRGAVGAIGGPPKVVKTWLALEFAISVATGTRACGTFYAERGTAAYVFAEDRGRQIKNRMRALLAGAGRTLPAGSLFLKPRGAFIDLLSNDDLAWIVASCRRCGKLDLLVLDPMRDLHTGEENGSDSMSDVMRRLRALGEILGCAVIVVHHMAKPSETNGRRGGGQKLRGNGAIHGSLDAGIYFVDSDKNGEDEWTAEIESELKGARSAGFFNLTLKVDDDERGEATRAVWTYEREEKATEPKMSKEEARTARKRKEEAEEERIAFEFVRELAMRGEHLTRQGLRDHDEAPLTDRRLYYAVCRQIDAGRLRLGPRGVVLLPEIPAQEDR